MTGRLVVLLGLLACEGEPQPDVEDTRLPWDSSVQPTSDDLAGAWYAGDEDIAPLFRAQGVGAIQLTLGLDGRYAMDTVEVTTGALTSEVGFWFADGEGPVFDIVLRKDPPNVFVLHGLATRDGDGMIADLVPVDQTKADAAFGMGSSPSGIASISTFFPVDP